MAEERIEIEGRQVVKLTTSSRKVWLDARSKNVSSTESAAIVGLSPYSSFLDLWAVKTGRLEDSFVANERTEVGQVIEHAISRLVSKRLGCKVLKLNDYLYEPEERIGSSFDYEIVDGDFAGWLLEIKNVDRLVFMDKWKLSRDSSDDPSWLPPEHIEVQAHHQMMVSGRPGVLLGALVGGNELLIHRYERDHEYEELLRNAIARFWADCETLSTGEVISRMELERDAEIVAKLFSTTRKDSVIDASVEEYAELSSYLDAYAEAQGKVKSWNEARKRLKATILARIGDTAKVIGRQHKLSTWNVAASPGKIITKEMVGTTLPGRAGFRGFRVTPNKESDK